MQPRRTWQTRWVWSILGCMVLLLFAVLLREGIASVVALGLIVVGGIVLSVRSKQPHWGILGGLVTLLCAFLPGPTWINEPAQGVAGLTILLTGLVSTAALDEWGPFAALSSFALLLITALAGPVLTAWSVGLILVDVLVVLAAFAGHRALRAGRAARIVICLAGIIALAAAGAQVGERMNEGCASGPWNFCPGDGPRILGLLYPWVVILILVAGQSYHVLKVPRETAQGTRP